MIPKLARSSRRRAQQFLLSYCCTKDNRACLLGLFSNLSRKGATRSVQAARWARTHSYSRSQNLAPNSNTSEPPPSTSRSDPREDQKRSAPLDPDTAPFETEKGHWIQEGCGGLYGIRGQTVLRPSAYVNFQLWGLTWGEETYRSPFVSTLCPVVLQIRYTQTIIVRMLTADLFTDQLLWRGVVVAPADYS